MLICLYVYKYSRCILTNCITIYFREENGVIGLKVGRELHFRPLLHFLNVVALVFITFKLN